jgi:hypothetical protein
MRVIVLIPILLGVILSFAQSSSTHYRSNARGMMLHGNSGQSNHTKNTVVNLWTEGHEQGSSYANNRSGGLFSPQRDTAVKFINRMNRGNVSIKPNPFTNIIEIAVNLNISTLEIEILDLQGRLVQQIKEEGKRVQINTSAIPEGIYLIRIKSEMSFLVQKMVKH